MKKLIKVEIDRQKWGRGRQEIGVDSALLNSTTGKMCCLGFAPLALGCTVGQIRDKFYPACVHKSIPKLSKRDKTKVPTGLSGSGRYRNTEFSKLAAEINDDFYMEEEERENRLKKLAQENGFNFVFKN